MTTRNALVVAAGTLKEVPASDVLGVAGGIAITEQAAPPTPSAGIVDVYAKTDARLYVKDPSGAEDGLQMSADVTRRLWFGV